MAFVYFIRSGKLGNPIKIGYAVDVDKRINELQIGNPQKLHIIAAIPVDSKRQAQNIEKWMHHRFKRKHIRGEWFNGCIKLKQVFSNLELAKRNVDYNELRSENGGKYYDK